MTPMMLLLASAFAQDELRPLKPAVPIPSESTMWPWMLAAAAMVVLSGLGWAAWKRWHRAVEPTPEALLRQGLAAAAACLEADDVKGAADAVDRSLRRFLAARLDGSIPQRTNDELGALLEPRLPAEVHQPLLALLIRCDAVRFAGAPTLDLDITWVDGLLAALAAPEEPDAPAALPNPETLLEAS